MDNVAGSCYQSPIRRFSVDNSVKTNSPLHISRLKNLLNNEIDPNDRTLTNTIEETKNSKDEVSIKLKRSTTVKLCSSCVVLNKNIEEDNQKSQRTRKIAKKDEGGAQNPTVSKNAKSNNKESQENAASTRPKKKTTTKVTKPRKTKKVTANETSKTEVSETGNLSKLNGTNDSLKLNATDNLSNLSVSINSQMQNSLIESEITKSQIENSQLTVNDNQQVKKIGRPKTKRATTSKKTKADTTIPKSAVDKTKKPKNSTKNKSQIKESTLNDTNQSEVLNTNEISIHSNSTFDGRLLHEIGDHSTSVEDNLDLNTHFDINETLKQQMITTALNNVVIKEEPVDDYNADDNDNFAKSYPTDENSLKNKLKVNDEKSIKSPKKMDKTKDQKQKKNATEISLKTKTNKSNKAKSKEMKDDKKMKKKLKKDKKLAKAVEQMSAHFAVHIGKVSELRVGSFYKDESLSSSSSSECSSSCSCNELSSTDSSRCNCWNCLMEISTDDNLRNCECNADSFGSSSSDDCADCQRTSRKKKRKSSKIYNLRNREIRRKN